MKKSPKTHCVSVYTVSTTSSPVDFKSGTRYEENETLPQTSACGISEIRIPSIFRARFSLVICPKNTWMLCVSSIDMMNPAAGDNQDAYQTLFVVTNRVDGTLMKDTHPNSSPFAMQRLQWLFHLRAPETAGAVQRL